MPKKPLPSPEALSGHFQRGSRLPEVTFRTSGEMAGGFAKAVAANMEKKRAREAERMAAAAEGKTLRPERPQRNRKAGDAVLPYRPQPNNQIAPPPNETRR